MRLPIGCTALILLGLTLLVRAAPLGAAAQTATILPVGQQDAFELLKNWTFGARRADATVRSKKDLDQDFYYRYIYAGGKLDGIPTYWSYHRDYPDGDPRSLHVFGDDALTLEGRIPPGGGLRPRGIESGILRAKLPITPGMYIEMRAKLPYGIGAWPAFWLNAGVQYDNNKFSDLPWPPEIDIFEFFNWHGRNQTRVMTGYVQSHNKPDAYDFPHDLWTKFVKGEYVPGFDFAAAFHVFALDWRPDEPIWLLDGVPIKQTHYKWNGPPAHLLITDQIGMSLAGADIGAMKADESQWNYVIDYIRIWRRPNAPAPPEGMKAR
jgi:hypothetical protein